MSNINKYKINRIKGKIRAEKKRTQHIYLAIAAAILIASAFLVSSILNQPSTPEITSPLASNPSVAIVDQLSLTRPNQTFVDEAKGIFEEAGFMFNYYFGEAVSVSCYRDLPVHGYDVILLRVHSAGLSAVGAAELQMFTCEPYSTQKYIKEQLAHQVGIVKYSANDTEMYFGICPGFVQEYMRGRFENTTIIMMGCDGLMGTQMAEAFIGKGARAYIGWDGPIVSYRNDPAIAGLLHHLLTEGQTVERAVAETMKEFPPDHIDKSTLLYYPLSAANYTIQT